MRESVREAGSSRRSAGALFSWVGLAFLLLCVSCSGDGPSQQLVAPTGSAPIEFREHLISGLELMRQGQEEGAEAEFRRCIALNPDDPKPHLHLGRILAARASEEGKIPFEAADELDKAVRLDPTDIAARLALAELVQTRYVKLYDPDRTMELYEGVFRDNPDLLEERLRYASWLLVSEVRMYVPGRGERVAMDSAWTMEAARSHLEYVLDRVSPTSQSAARAHILMTDVLMRSGFWQECLRETELILTRYPTLPKERRERALRDKGHCLYREGRYEEALAVFRGFYDSSPGNRALYDIYQTTQKMGGYPDDLPPKYRFPLREEATGADLPPAPRLRDIASELGVVKVAGAGPGSWGDYDRDGLYDLLACGCDTFCSLFKNEGDRFRDVTLEAGLGKAESGFAAVWGDYDANGHLDIYIARNGWTGPGPDSLLRNRGDGTFEEVTEAAGFDEPGSGFHATWIDYDRDGWLDLFVSNGSTLDPYINHLYRNNEGNGTFENVTVAAGLEEELAGGTIGVAAGDYDLDGWVDLFIHGRRGANRLYHNRGDGTFEEVAKEAGVIGEGNQNGYVALFHDMDSDGDLDLLTNSLAHWDQVLEGYRADFVPYMQESLPRLYRNDGNGRFTDISWDVGLVYPIGVMAANVGDIDNNGYADILLGTGNPDIRRLEPNILYMNTGKGQFIDRTRSAGVGELGKGHGITFNDWDGDGDLEIFAELGGFYHGDLWESVFYLNETENRYHYLEVDLVHEGPNWMAVGAGVTVKAGDLTIYQEVSAGRGFGSNDPPTLHYGLGKNDQVEWLRVRWPDGTTVEYPPPTVDQRIRIRRGEKTWTTVAKKR